MSQAPTAEEVAKRRVVYKLHGVDDVVLRQDIEFRAADGGALAMDVYHPADAGHEAVVPAVILVAGYPDEGLRKIVGCRFKELGSSVSWSRLVAASGIAAITYTNREPVADLQALIDHVRLNAGSIGIDADRIGIWASSGNVPLALSLLMQGESLPLRCAVLCYGYMLDFDGATAVADGCRLFRFANPNAGKSVDDVPSNLPVFIARAGADQMPRLNESIDRFVGAALARNLPIVVANHATGPHAFDLFDDSATSREIIRGILRFLQFHLLAPLVEPDTHGDG